MLIGGVTLLIVLLLLCFMRTRIKIAIELIEEGSIAVKDMTSTLFFPVIPFLLELIFVAWFLTVAAFLASSNEKKFHFNINSDEDKCELNNGTEIKDGRQCFNENQTLTCADGTGVTCEFYKFGPKVVCILKNYQRIFNFFVPSRLKPLIWLSTTFSVSFGVCFSWKPLTKWFCQVHLHHGIGLLTSAMCPNRPSSQAFIGTFIMISQVRLKVLIHCFLPEHYATIWVRLPLGLFLLLLSV